MRTGRSWQSARQPWVRRDLDLLANGNKTGPNIEGQRPGTVQSAGVYVKPFDLLRERSLDRMGHQPSACPEADGSPFKTKECQFTVIALAKVQFQKANIATFGIHDDMNMHMRIAENSHEFFIAQTESREPKPFGTDQPEERPISIR